jgi:OPA family glycerol-3-phosphate transporter-like MFS transporter
MSATSAAPVMDETPVHSPAFLTRRTQNWLSLGFTYAAMYMARYNFPLANKALSDTYGWDKDAGRHDHHDRHLCTASRRCSTARSPTASAAARAMLIGAGGAFVFNLLFGLGAYLGVLGTGPCCSPTSPRCGR